MKHTPTSAAIAVRHLLNTTIAKTWAEYFDGQHKAHALNAAKLVQEQCNGPQKETPVSYREASLAVKIAIPELFAEYWENLI